MAYIAIYGYTGLRPNSGIYGFSGFFDFCKMLKMHKMLKLWFLIFWPKTAFKVYTAYIGLYRVF